MNTKKTRSCGKTTRGNKNSKVKDCKWNRNGKSPFDILGSYTGTAFDEYDKKPVQDADDL